MELETYVDSVRDQLAASAELGGPEVAELAERLAGSLEAATRLALLDALSAATDEITSDLAPGSVELRLQGREATFVVTLPSTDDADENGPWTPPAAPPPVSAETDESLTRINLRLSTDLKNRVEEAARGTGQSVNAWLVRAATAALEPNEGTAGRRGPRGGDRYSGWLV
jgi:hypothetical protein